MISNLALSELKRLRRDGLTPSDADVIRLNALGLKIEFAGEAGDMFALPRVAYLGSLKFREPSVGHVIWVDSVITWCNRHSLDTFTAVNAFALSRDQSELPDPTDRKLVKSLIDDFCRVSLAPFTSAQIRAAVGYALHGSDVTYGEIAADPPFTPDAPQRNHLPDADARSIGVGFIIESFAVGLGLSIADIKSLTPAQVRTIQTLALRRNRVNLKDSYEPAATADFYNTLDEITDRLRKEAKSEGDTTNGKSED